MSAVVRAQKVQRPGRGGAGLWAVACTFLFACAPTTSDVEKATKAGDAAALQRLVTGETRSVHVPALKALLKLGDAHASDDTLRRVFGSFSEPELVDEALAAWPSTPEVLPAAWDQNAVPGREANLVHCLQEAMRIDSAKVNGFVKSRRQELQRRYASSPDELHGLLASLSGLGVSADALRLAPECPSGSQAREASASGDGQVETWCERTAGGSTTKVGTYVWWFRSGLPEAEVEFSDGSKPAHEVLWSEAGKKVGEGPVVGRELIKDGDWNESTEQGDWTGTYARGVRQGTWRLETKSDDDSVLSGEYRNGKEEGVWTLINRAGFKHSDTTYRHGVKIEFTSYGTDISKRCTYDRAGNESCKEFVDESSLSCAEVLRLKKLDMAACESPKCDRYALGGAREDVRTHARCLDACAEKIGGRYAECYRELMEQVAGP